MKFTVNIEVNDEQLEELKLLQSAMIKASDSSNANEYYTLENVIDFVMMLSSTDRINKAIENAAYHYDKYYDDYPYKYGNYRTQEMLKKEKETGEYLDHAYPNPRIDRL